MLLEMLTGNVRKYQGDNDASKGNSILLPKVGLCQVFFCSKNAQMSLNLELISQFHNF